MKLFIFCFLISIVYCEQENVDDSCMKMDRLEQFVEIRPITERVFEYKFFDVTYVLIVDLPPTIAGLKLHLFCPEIIFTLFLNDNDNNMYQCDAPGITSNSITLVCQQLKYVTNVSCAIRNENFIPTFLKSNETLQVDKYDTNLHIMTAVIFIVVTLILIFICVLSLEIKNIKESQIKLTNLVTKIYNNQNDFYYHQKPPYVLREQKHGEHAGITVKEKLVKEVKEKEAPPAEEESSECSSETASYDHIEKWKSTKKLGVEKLHQLILARNAFQWRLHYDKSDYASSFEKAPLVIAFERNTVIAYNLKTEKLTKFPAAVDYSFHPSKAGVAYDSSMVVTPTIIENPPKKPLIKRTNSYGTLQYHVIETDDKEKLIQAERVVIDLIKKAAKSINQNEGIILLTPAHISESQKLAYEHVARKSRLQNFFCTDEQLALGYSISELVQANIILINCYETQVVISQFQIENENARKVVELNDAQKSGKDIKQFVEIINDMMKVKTIPSEMLIFVTRNRDIFYALKDHYLFRDTTAILKFMGNFEEMLVKVGSGHLYFDLSDLIQLHSKFNMTLNNLLPEEMLPKKKCRTQSV